jgi:bifunctional DNA-binding transcriptional regulator/antitoxin component of YhaV-PrlF toxin-antitoxin module
MTAIIINHTGRLEIPLEIRQQLELTTEQFLNLEVSNGCIILQPLERAPKVHRLGTCPSSRNLAPWQPRNPHR